MDTLLYDYSIPVISSLQRQLGEQESAMQSLSVIFDPKYAFLIYSPIAYLLDKGVGKKLIMTTVIAEWLNQILKWLLHGERPYWYVHSSGHFDAQQTPIRQFPITCELGPGHPSGHAMVTSAVWYIILTSLLQAYQNYSAGARSSINTSHQQQNVTDGRKSSSLMATLATWALYVGLITAVSVSRVFLGCHFPHQCLAGAALGLLTARYVCRRNTKALHYIAASAFLMATAFGTFALLQALGFDPSWTIRLATTHCVKREYIHLDTAPFFSIMRYCGFALGCGLGLLFPVKPFAQQLIAPLVEVNETLAIGGEASSVAEAEGAPDKSALSSRNLSWLSAKLVTALVMARLVDNLGLFVSHANLTIFYSCAFLAYTLFSYAFINL